MNRIIVSPGEKFIPERISSDIHTLLYKEFFGDVNISGNFGEHKELNIPILFFGTKIIEMAAKYNLINDKIGNIMIPGTQRYLFISEEENNITIDAIGEETGSVIHIGCSISKNIIEDIVAQLCTIFQRFSIELGPYKHYLAQNWVLESIARRSGLR